MRKRRDIEARLTDIDLPSGSLTVRSVLEGRWAIFFDTLKLGWQYEPKITRYYWPDFKIEGAGYVEIKPSIRLLGSESERKITRFCKENPTEKVYAFCSSNVSFDIVALFESDRIYAPTFQHMAQIVAKVRDPKRIETFESHCEAIKHAFNLANQYKFSDWMPVGRVLGKVIDDLKERLNELDVCAA